MSETENTTETEVPAVDSSGTSMSTENHTARESMEGSQSEDSSKKIFISYRLLRRAGACPGQRELFVKIFDQEEVEVTEELAVKHAGIFEWVWAVENLLGYDVYEKMFDTDKAVKEASDKLFELNREAWEAYHDSIDAEYPPDRADVKEASKILNEAKARYFVKALYEHGFSENLQD